MDWKLKMELCMKPTSGVPNWSLRISPASMLSSPNELEAASSLCLRAGKKGDTHLYPVNLPRADHLIYDPTPHPAPE